MKKGSFSKLAAITPNTLIVGIDIAKNTHWARFTDYRGIPLGKALKVSNNKIGFENILTTIKGVCKQHNLSVRVNNLWVLFLTSKIMEIKLS